MVCKKKKERIKGAKAACYDEYRMTVNERIRYFAVIGVLALLISYLFYDSWYAAVVLIPVGILFMKKMGRELMDKRKSELRRQFQDMIDSVSSALTAGYSVENAFYEAKRDMIRLYGQGSIIVSELEYFFSLLETGQTLEAILNDFPITFEHWNASFSIKALLISGLST